MFFLFIYFRYQYFRGRKTAIIKYRNLIPVSRVVIWTLRVIVSSSTEILQNAPCYYYNIRHIMPISKPIQKCQSISSKLEVFLFIWQDRLARSFLPPCPYQAASHLVKVCQIHRHKNRVGGGMVLNGLQNVLAVRLENHFLILLISICKMCFCAVRSIAGRIGSNSRDLCKFLPVLRDTIAEEAVIDRKSVV